MVNEKDVMRKLKYFAGIAAALMLWGCSEDKFVPDQYLNGLGGDEYVLKSTSGLSIIIRVLTIWK